MQGLLHSHACPIQQLLCLVCPYKGWRDGAMDGATEAYMDGWMKEWRERGRGNARGL